MKKQYFFLSLLSLVLCSPLLASDKITLLLPRIAVRGHMGYVKERHHEDQFGLIPSVNAYLFEEVDLQNIRKFETQKMTFYSTQIKGNRFFFHAEIKGTLGDKKMGAFEVLNAGMEKKFVKDQLNTKNPFALKGFNSENTEKWTLKELTEDEKTKLTSAQSEYKSIEGTPYRRMLSWLKTEAFKTQRQELVEVKDYRAKMSDNDEKAHILKLVTEMPHFLEDKTLDSYDPRFKEIINTIPPEKRKEQIRTMLAKKANDLYTGPLARERSTELNNFFKNIETDEHISIMEKHFNANSLRGNLPSKGSATKSAHLFKHPTENIMYTYNKRKDDGTPGVLHKVIFDDSGTKPINFIKVTGSEKANFLDMVSATAFAVDSCLVSYDERNKWHETILPEINKLPQFAPDPEPKPAAKPHPVDDAEPKAGKTSPTIGDTPPGPKPVSGPRRSPLAPPKPPSGDASAPAPLVHASAARVASQPHASAPAASTSSNTATGNNTKIYGGRALQAAGGISVLYALYQLIERYKAQRALEEMVNPAPADDYNPLFDEQIEAADPLQEALLKRQRNQALVKAILAGVLGTGGLYGGHRLAAAAA